MLLYACPRQAFLFGFAARRTALPYKAYRRGGFLTRPQCAVHHPAGPTEASRRLHLSLRGRLRPWQSPGPTAPAADQNCRCIAALISAVPLIRHGLRRATCKLWYDCHRQSLVFRFAARSATPKGKVLGASILLGTRRGGFPTLPDAASTTPPVRPYQLPAKAAPTNFPHSSGALRADGRKSDTFLPFVLKLSGLPSEEGDFQGGRLVKSPP